MAFFNCWKKYASQGEKDFDLRYALESTACLTWEFDSFLYFQNKLKDKVYFKLSVIFVDFFLPLENFISIFCKIIFYRDIIKFLAISEHHFWENSGWLGEAYP